MQVMERVVTAVDEEHATAKLQEELRRPYGFLGSWETVDTNMEVVEAHSKLETSPDQLGGRGALLLSINDAAKLLGLSRGTLYELVTRGEIDHVTVGRRRLISRDQINAFIQANTQRGRTW
jgi:excisionase family DNA binding protein